MEQRRIVAVLEDHISRLDAADAYLAAVERRAEGLLAASLRHLVHRSGDDGELRCLDDVATWGSGGTPRAGDSRYYAQGTLPWAVIGDLDDGPLRQTARSITELGLKESAAKVVPAGSVLVAMYGSIGKLALPEIRLATNQAIAFARPNDDVGRLFLFWYLRSQRSALMSAGKGGTQKNISQTVLKAWPIPVPSRQAQDELVSVVEAAAESRSRIIHEVQRQRRASTALRRSLLTAAFTGRLTGRSSDMDVAEELAEAAS